MKPSDFFNVHPWDSVSKDANTELVATNIMTILKRTGNKFRELSWEEYKRERLIDGDFSMIERKHFDKAIPFCKNKEAARLFSDSWKEIQ